MPTVDSIDNAALVLALFVPGLVAYFVRSQFVGAEGKDHKDRAITYFVLSVIYLGLVSPFLPAERGWLLNPVAWLLLVFVGPALFGGILGVSAQKNWIWRLARRCGLNPRHGMPTAWDWKFSHDRIGHVLVKLKDGTKFAGDCGSGSFISTDPSHRDIYIEKVYVLEDGTNNWIDDGPRSVLISPDEIQTIEFFDNEEAVHEEDDRSGNDERQREPWLSADSHVS